MSWARKWLCSLAVNACAACGKSLVKKDGTPAARRAFCSEACRMIEVACVVCGAKIVHRRDKASDKFVPKTCSKECYHRSTALPGKKPRPCETCGAPVFIRSQTYCSEACSTVDQACAHCGVVFRARRCYVRLNRANCCSEKCRRERARKGFSSEELDRSCEVCGRAIRVTPVNLKRGIDRRHCSNACRTKGTTRPCKTCGKPVYARQSQKHRQFCSRRCYRMHTGETGLEATVRMELTRLRVPFKQEVDIGRWTVDFLAEGRWVIEADGDYWHASPKVRQRDARRDVQLAAMGYTVVRLAEKDVNADPACIERALKGSGLLRPGTLHLWATLSPSQPSNDTKSPAPRSTFRSKKSPDTSQLAWSFITATPAS